MGKNKKKRAPKKTSSKAAAAQRERNEKRLSTVKTPNGRHIVKLMIEEKIKGNYKDYVIIIGDQLLDWRRTMTMKTTEGASVGVNQPVLVHKSKLKNIISQEAAETFWHPRYGRLVDVPPATKPKGK